MHICTKVVLNKYLPNNTYSFSFIEEIRVFFVYYKLFTTSIFSQNQTRKFIR